MTLRSMFIFFSVQFISLNLAHKLAHRGAIEYSILVNVTLIGVLSFFWPRHLFSNFKIPLESRRLFGLVITAFIGISIAFLCDYFIWLFMLEPSLRNLEWENGLPVAGLYYTASAVALIFLSYLSYLLIKRRV